jgi:hypothetical protein
MAFPQISRRALGLLLVIAAAAAIVSPATADEVVALTEADFEKEVGQDRGALVEFYAPWFAPLSPHLCLVIGPDPWFVGRWVWMREAGMWKN